MKKTKWGILGAGKIATIFATALKTIPSAEMTAVASINLEEAIEFGKQFDIKQCYGQLQALMEDDTIDIIYVAIPHTFHKQYVINCLEHGKHVMCEKPLGTSYAEVKEMVELAQEKGLFLMEGLWTMFLPVTKAVQAAVTQGEIGPVKLVRAEFGFPAPKDPASRFRNPKLGGGALLDIGIYPLAYATMIYDQEPVEIKSMTEIGPTGVDIGSSIIMDYGDGKRAECAISFEALLPNEAIIVGEKGFIRVEQFFSASKATVYTNYCQTQRLIEIPFECNGYEYQAEAVTDLIAANDIKSDLVPHRLSLRVAKIMDDLKDQMCI